MKTLIVALYPYGGQGLDAWHDHGAGMTYAAAKAAGCDVSFLDLKVVKDDADLKERLKGYDLVGFGLKSSYYQIGMKVARFAKENGSKTIIGGYHITAAPDEIEQGLFDYVFHGESELTFPKFLQSPESFSRDIYGEKVPDLDLLPWIDRTLYRDTLENCSFWWHGGQRRKMLSVISARGCPFQCSFCQPLEDNHFGRKLRRRSVDSLIAELKMLKEKFHPECLMIHDDTFFVQPKWIEEFIEKYPQIGLPFWAAARSDGICQSPDLVRRLVKVGWELVSVGFESGSQRMLDKMKKGVTVEQNLESAKIIKSAGAKIYANYILGFPWETREDIQATMRMADQINAEMPSWAFFTPYPGCGLAEECVKNGWSLLDRTTYDRCPSGRKVRNVDYEYVNKALKGFREDIPKLQCDIIIPAYQNELLTLNCIKSIKRYTTRGTYRIILVDNGSKLSNAVDESLKDTDAIILRLPTNEGFVGAVNRGLEISDAPNICLLNNDTVVTKNWLGKLLKTLYSDPSIGIVGALTGYHEVGQDSHHSLNLHSTLLPPEARKWDFTKINEDLERLYSGRTHPIEFVAFLCAVIKREVFNKVGLLDPNYAMGMWDDVDYNRQVQKLGYKTVLALDTCIYHRGRSTFNLIQKDENFNVNDLLRKNRAYLDKKWRGNVPKEVSSDTIIISRAIYDKLGDKFDIGVLDPNRLDLMQRYFINSLRNQTDYGFSIYMVVGAEKNETTEAIKKLDWGNLDVKYIYTTGDLSGWRNAVADKRNKGKEINGGSPEDIVRTIDHPLTKIMARMDTDDWVAPGWVAHMKRLAAVVKEPRFLINYQVIGQDPNGYVYEFANVHTRERTSPFISLVQKTDPRISPYKDFHLSMGRYFESVFTVPPGYVYMVVHGENRSNRVYRNDKYIGLPGQAITVELPSPKQLERINLRAGKDRNKIPTRIVHRPDGLTKIQYERFVAQGGLRSI